MPQNPATRIDRVRGGDFTQVKNARSSTSVQCVVLACATTGSYRARAQSAVADGARNRNRKLRVHGMNAPCLTAHKPPFPNLRIMLLISTILFITSIAKFQPKQRVDRDGMIQLRARSSTSTSTKNSQNKTMHRSGRSASLNFRNHFGGHSVMVAANCLDQRAVSTIRQPSHRSTS